ncbi:hypothetical protein [Paenibacillus sp. PvR052]
MVTARRTPRVRSRNDIGAGNRPFLVPKDDKEESDEQSVETEITDEEAFVFGYVRSHGRYITSAVIG